MYISNAGLRIYRHYQRHRRTFLRYPLPLPSVSYRPPIVVIWRKAPLSSNLVMSLPAIAALCDPRKMTDCARESLLPRCPAPGRRNMIANGTCIVPAIHSDGRR